MPPERRAAWLDCRCRRLAAAKTARRRLETAPQIERAARLRALERVIILPIGCGLEFDPLSNSVVDNHALAGEREQALLRDLCAFEDAERWRAATAGAFMGPDTTLFAMLRSAIVRVFSRAAQHLRWAMACVPRPR